MTVGELIAQLAACDPDARIALTNDADETVEIEPVVTVDGDLVVIG